MSKPFEMTYTFERVTFADWLARRVGKNWVVARRSLRIVERYGSDVACLSPQGYGELCRKYGEETGWCWSRGPGTPCEPLAAMAPAMLSALIRIGGMSENPNASADMRMIARAAIRPVAP